MAASRDERRAAGDADRDWYFDEDGSLAAAGRAPRVKEWLGMGYALFGLALGSSSWLGPADRSTRGLHGRHAETRHVA